MSARGRSNLLIAVASAVLILYLVLLIALVFLGQRQLQERTLRREQAELEQQAEAIGYLLDEQRGAIAGLAADPALGLHLSRRDHDASMHFAPGTVPPEPVERMRRLKSDKQIHGHPIYRRITLYDAQRHAVASDEPIGSPILQWKGPIPSAGEGATLIDDCGRDPAFACLVAAVPGRHGQTGVLVAQLEPTSVLTTLMHMEGIRDPLIRRSNGTVLFPRAQPPAGGPESRVLRQNIPGTSLVLEKTLPSRAARGYLTLPQLPWGICLLALPMLIGLALLLRANNRNTMLRAQNEIGAAQQDLLQRQRDMHGVVGDIAATLLGAPLDEMDQAIDWTLAISGEHLSADRAYLFLYSEDGSRLSNTHEWCADGIDPQKEGSQDIPAEATPWWWQQLARRGLVVVPDVAALPSEAAAEKAISESRGIQSLFAFPLQKSGRTFGFIGYDSVTRKRDWASEEIDLLSLVADLVSSALARWDVEESLESSLVDLHEAEQIGRIGSWSRDLDSGKTVWSQGEHLIQDVASDVTPSLERRLERIHEQDRERFEREYRANLKSSDSAFVQEYRLRRGDGEIRHILTRYRVSRDPSGRALSVSGTDQDISGHKQVEDALQEAMASREAILSAVPDLMFELDEHGRYLNVWARNTEELAASRDLLLGHRVSEILPQEAADRVMLAIREASLHGQSRGQQIWLNTPAGEQWFELSTSLKGYDGTVSRYIMLSRNITERKRAEQRLQLAASVFTHAREGIVITDVDGDILDINGAFTSITGYGLSDVAGFNLRGIKGNAGEQSEHTIPWSELERDGHWSGELWSQRKDGSVYAEMLTISAVLDEHEVTKHYVGLFSDVTAQKEQQIQLEHIAHHDALTNMPNRILLADRLRQTMAQAERHDNLLAVAYLDLDGFKQINDAYGHETGDDFLIAIAHRMKDALRQADTFARLGGDEFVAVMADLPDRDACLSAIERLLAISAQPIELDDVLLRVSASIGVTFFPQRSTVDPDQLLRQADQAMYQAKLAGKNRYHIFDATRDHQVRTRHESLERIRRALSEGELRLHYQPIVNMRSGEVVAAEALIRWAHPERGLLVPAHFLPTIEGHALATEVDLWSIESALEQLDAWQGRQAVKSISVNVGAEIFQRGDFFEKVGGLLAAHPRVTPDSLQLEIIETSALEDMAQVTRVMHDFATLGISFALDDFGTGYSSLTYLKRLPAARLKVDQSFVRDMNEDPEDLAIVEGVLGLARAFNRQAVAEGVETRGHAEMLLQLGCELAQGYYFSRPMPAERMIEWLADWRPDPTLSDIRPLSREALQTLFASVEHRAWLRLLESHTRGIGETQPTRLDRDHCRFCRWLDVKGRRQDHGDPTLEALRSLHEQAHAMADELISTQSRGGDAPQGPSLEGLHDLAEQVQRRLRDLMLADEPL